MSRILSIYDKAAQSFGNPIISDAVGVVARLLGDEINRSEPTELFAKHPADFSLYEIGIWDNLTGHIEPVEPTFLLSLESLKSE